jgi:hypothetical protein
VVAATWLDWWTANRVAAAAATGQLLVLVLAALYARAQVREARKLRQDQARPSVVVDFEPEQSPCMNLVVANPGKTMARNVAEAVHRGHRFLGAREAGGDAVRHHDRPQGAPPAVLVPGPVEMSHSQSGLAALQRGTPKTKPDVL